MDWITCVGLLDWWQTSAVSCSLAHTEARKSRSGATSSGRCSGTGSSTGWRETASAAKLWTPGMWMIWKRNRSDRSFRLRRRRLGMPSRDLSLNVFTRGLWSTATVRFGQPKTKWRAFSRASTGARASPSIGAYRVSAPEVNRLPTRVVFHPVLQQKGRDDWHSQCFWNNQNPMPSLLQSLTRQVGLFLS